METYNVEKMIGKELTFKGKRYTIDCYEIHNWNGGIDTIYFGLKLVKGKASDKTYIPTTAFDREETSTQDKELLEFVAKCNKDFNAKNSVILAQKKAQEEQERLARIQREKDEEAYRLQWIEEQKIKGAQKGREDARNKISTLHKIFTTKTYACIVKASNYSVEFRDAYVIAYEDEKKVMKQEKLIASRAKYDTLDEYPGDLEELILWMRKNLLRIDVFASPDKIENEQMAVDAINERDGTNYQVKIRQGQYVAYEAFFKNPSTAPKEFLTWMVSKHDYTTSDLNQRVMAHPMNVDTGKMTCNSLVKELVYSSEYAFHVGKATC